MVVKQRRSWLLLPPTALLVILPLMIVGCGGTPMPTPEPTFVLEVSPGTEVPVGKSVAIVAKVEPLEKLELKWSVSGTAEGELNTSTGEQVVYTPDQEGVDFVVAEGTTASGMPVKQTVSLTVVGEPSPTPEPPPTDTPTATLIPTATPTPTLSATPTNTPTSTPTATPTNTPSPTSTATPTNTPTLQSFQNFEPANGTPGDYFWDAWFMKCSFSEDTVYEGQRAMCCRAFADEKGSPEDTGGTVGIKPSSSEPIDLSYAETFYVWVYDTQGYNNAELKLCDAEGCATPVWSEMQSSKGEWAKITWPLLKFTDVYTNDIRHIEIYEWNDGLYCFDTIGWE